MGFCGTIALERRWRMVAFAMRCAALGHVLFDLQDAVLAKADGRVPRIAKDEKGGQIEMFPLATSDREDFAKFAANLRFLKSSAVDAGGEYWKEYAKHEYPDYEFSKLVENMPESEVAAAAEAMEKVGAGEPLESYRPLMDFLRKLSSRAHAATDRGGCF